MGGPQGIPDDSRPPPRMRRLSVLVPADLLAEFAEAARDRERSTAAQLRWLLRRFTDDPESFDPLDPQ